MTLIECLRYIHVLLYKFWLVKLLFSWAISSVVRTLVLLGLLSFIVYSNVIAQILRRTEMMERIIQFRSWCWEFRWSITTRIGHHHIIQWVVKIIDSLSHSQFLIWLWTLVLLYHYLMRNLMRLIRVTTGWNILYCLSV